MNQMQPAQPGVTTSSSRERPVPGTDSERRIDVVLAVIALALALMGLCRAFSAELRASLDESTMKYMVVAAAVLVLPRLRSLSFGDLKLELEETKAAVKNLRARTEDAAEGASAALRVAESSAPGARREGVEREAAAAGRSPASAAGDLDDPQKGHFGEQSHRDGCRLRGFVRPIPATDELFLVTLQLDDVRGRPLGRKVRFHLHPTFRPMVRDVPVADGMARLELVAWGAFTVGAELEDGTRLELDLSGPEVEAPRKFKSR